ncbi:protein of unknown function [Moritella yayanosii]|uniref:Uncharacterized protein n=1 Tax=Moritella yayanosii TaxID=69539 RepID=A0A330LP19_9GAMM|nr:protein of unknown function [Moritella yayanosii]
MLTMGFFFFNLLILKIKLGKRLVLNIKERHRIIIDCMGPTYQQVYS